MTRSSANDGASSDRFGGAGLTSSILGVVVCCAIAGTVSAVTGRVASSAVAVLIGIPVGLVFVRRNPLAGVVGLFLSSWVVASAPLPDGADTGGVVCACAAIIVAAAARVLVERRSIWMPSGMVGWFLLAYVAAAAIATVLAGDRVRSVEYLVKLVILLGALVIALPTLLGERTSLVVAIATAATGAVAAISGVVLAVSGPLRVQGRYVGLYDILEYTWGGDATGIVAPRITGVYTTPGYQSLVVAFGLVALVGLWPLVRSRWRWAVGVAIGASVVAEVLAQSRTGLLVAALGSAAILAIDWWTRTTPRAVAIVCSVVFGVIAVAGLMGVLGANARYDLAADRYGREATEYMLKQSRADVDLAGSDGSYSQDRTVEVRGGVDSSSRRILLNASFDALRARPILGYGLGSDPDAIASYLVGDAKGYRGLSSHNTLLIAWIEGGLLFAVFLVVLVAGAVVTTWRRLRASPGDVGVRVLAALQIAAVPGLAFEAFYLGALGLHSAVWALAMLVPCCAPHVLARRPGSTSAKDPDSVGDS